MLDTWLVPKRLYGNSELGDDGDDGDDANVLMSRLMVVTTEKLNRTTRSARRKLNRTIEKLNRTTR